MSIPNLHHSDQLLHDGNVKECEVVGAGSFHVRDDHHPLDVQLVGALLIKKKLSSYWLQRHHLNCRGDDHLTSPHQMVEVDLGRVDLLPGRTFDGHQRTLYTAPPFDT